MTSSQNRRFFFKTNYNYNGKFLAIMQPGFHASVQLIKKQLTKYVYASKYIIIFEHKLFRNNSKQAVHFVLSILAITYSFCG